VDRDARRLIVSGIALLGASLPAACDSASESDETPASAAVPVAAVAVTDVDPASLAATLGLDESILRRALRASPLPAPPPDSTNRVADDPRAAELGRTLFFDPALSGTGEVSCATCHQPALRFTDGLPLSKGVGTAGRHAPTLVDAAHHRWFNWDGRSDSMWGHSIRPIENADEMAGDRTAVVRRVLGDDALRRSYEAIFGPADVDVASLPARARPDGDPEAESAWAAMTEADRFQVDRAVANIGKTFAAYQRTLAGGPTRFDDWVESIRGGGNGEDVLSASERRGLALFFGRAECWECHAGPLFSDGEFHNIGIPAPNGLPRDEGRYVGARLVREDAFNAAGPHSDDPDGDRGIVSRGVREDPGQWGAFRTPMLRGVGRTAPYMHDGSMPDLASVLRFYSTLEGAVQLDHHQESVLTPLGLSDEELADLEAFLRTLDGGLPGLGDAPGGSGANEGR
jgi:cytochrome c peroxidase